MVINRIALTNHLSSSSQPRTSNYWVSIDIDVEATVVEPVSVATAGAVGLSGDATSGFAPSPAFPLAAAEL